MMMKVKMLPGYKPSPLGPIPNDWEVKTVSEAFQICNNLRFPISQEERSKIKGKYPYYGPTKIQDYINDYRVNGKYSLIGEDGDHFLKWRDLPMTLLVEGKFNVNNHAHLVKGNENNTEWFYYYFNHRELTPYLTRQGAGRYKLTKDSLSKIPIALPTNPKEQTAIANLLSTWDRAITHTTQLIAQNELRKKWLMQQLLTGKKRLKGFKEEWREVKIDDITTNFSRRNKGLINAKVYSVTNTNGFVLQSEHFEREVAGSDLTNYKIIKKNEFAYNPARINVGSIAYFENEIGVISSLYVCFSTKKDILDYYLFQFLQLDHTKHRIESLGEGGVRIYLWYDLFAKIKIKLPSIKEQLAITKVLESADAELNLLHQKLDKLKEQKRGLMQILLTGKKRLKIAGIKPTEASAKVGRD